MKKNVASQAVGCQLVSATDGSAVTTGTTTVYVTGDAGTQAAGSVGSGACTHEGNGYWTYAPAQAETNYDLVAFTFVNTAAVNATVQIYTTFPQTGDSYARIGAPVGASISADVAGCLHPTTAGRTLDVSATGEAGVDWANIGSPTTVVNLSGTTIKTATDVEADTSQFVFTVAGQVDANIQYVNDVAVTGNGGAGTEWGP